MINFRDQFYDFITTAQYLCYIFLCRCDKILTRLSYVIKINLIYGRNRFHIGFSIIWEKMLENVSPAIQSQEVTFSYWRKVYVRVS